MMATGTMHLVFPSDFICALQADVKTRCSLYVLVEKKSCNRMCVYDERTTII
jgi:hypothetical protein